MLVQQKFEEAGLVAEAEHTHESVIWTTMLLLPLVSPCTHSSGGKEAKKRKEKTTPFGVNLVRSPVYYRAAQGQGGNFMSRSELC